MFGYAKNLYNKEETAAEHLWEERWDAAGVGTKVAHSNTTLAKACSASSVRELLW